MEGGGIATDDDAFADDLRSMRSHGWSRDRADVSTWNSQVSNNDSKFLFVSTGYNVRPMEIQAAIGSLQIDELESFVDKRREIAQRVCHALSGTKLSVIGKNAFQSAELMKTNSWMLIPIKINGDSIAERKELILNTLAKLEIETRPVLTGNFLSQPAIQRITRHAVDPKSFKAATEITESAFLVGAHHDLTEEQIKFLCDSLKEVSSIE
jgi:CDP-6-deoxy-D-xylo-4-hexulose-3-dehydrase